MSDDDKTRPITKRPEGHETEIATQVSADLDKTEISTNDPSADESFSSDTLAMMQPGFMLKDRFQLGEKLGQGGMGAVFRARDLRRVEAGHSDPTVAIKVITGDFAKDSRAFIALQRETDKSQTLAHPNIITVYDFDRDDTIFFMTMESLSGVTLDSYISSDAERAERIAYITDLGNAIAYAHKRNIVHSDLKPANIFITRENVLKVLDFGIARAYSSIEGDKTQADPDEISGLTPTYASYEMFERQAPHPADDVYALGLIAYEMLAGKHPFDRKSAPRAESLGLKPKRIKGLPAYQWKAIAKALEFRREDRWQDAGQFLSQFKGTGRRVRQLSAALLVAILGFSSYLLFFQPEAGPDIPFEDLPPATQESVLKNLSEGRQALKFGDYNGALFYLDKAYQLHPRNPDVMKSIDTMLDEIFGNMASPENAAQKAEYRQQLSELLKYPSLSQNPRLQEKKKSLEASN
jgi:serine/threonine protein kinase